MQTIENKLNSPYLKDYITTDLDVNFEKITDIKTEWERKNATVSKIRLSPGFPIPSFRTLVGEVAKISISNKNFEMFYRGQTNDYKDKNGKTVIYPTICRPTKKEDGSLKSSIRANLIESRYSQLNNRIKNYKGSTNQMDEYYLSLFQHYEIMPTPLIDITQSLNVAATFALRHSNIGYLYVFGLPYPQGSISHFIDHQIVLIKLQNVCPIDAFRPRYQEGYLVGKLPIRATKEGGDNLARRLIAKFQLINEEDSFWDNNFKPIPDEVLFPIDDVFLSRMNTL